MNVVSECPILEQIVRSKKSKARRLDSRAVAALYAEASEEWWFQMSTLERKFSKAAVDAQQSIDTPL